MNNLNLSVGDTVDGLAVTKITDKSCWLAEKRFSWKTIEQNQRTLQTRVNANIEIDWSSMGAVSEFYKTFTQWSFYISNGDSGKAINKLVQVIGGMVYYENEYYLPAPKGHGNKQTVEDGHYYASLLKRSSGWYGSEKRAVVRVFWCQNAVNIEPTAEDIRSLKPNNKEIYCYPYSYKGFGLDYEQNARSGLSIYNIRLNDFSAFFKEIYCSTRWGYTNQHTIVSDEILHKIECGLGEISIVEEINRILNESTYHINDSDSYGDYILNYIIIDKTHCEKIFDLIDARLKKYI